MTRALPEAELPAEPDAEALASAVQSVRRLISHLRKTKADTELLERVAQQANALSDQLAAYDHPGPYMQRHLILRMEDMARDSDLPAEYFPYSPVIGPLNPIAPPVEFRFEGKEMSAVHSFDAPYNGPPAAVHGGVIALVFDELLGALGAMAGIGGFTGTLSVRYLALTPIGQPIAMRSWIEWSKGRKVQIRGTMHDGDTLCAEAEGLFIRPKESMLQDSLAKFESR